MTVGKWASPKTYSASKVVSVVDRNVYESSNLTYLYEVPACEIKATPDAEQSAQGVSALVYTKVENMTTVAYDTEDTGNNDGMAQNGTLVIPEAAGWLVVAKASFENLTGNATFKLGVFVNDVLDQRLEQAVYNQSTAGADLHVAHIVNLDVGDVLDIRVTHDFEANQALRRSLDDDSVARLSAARVAPGV